MIYSNEVNPQYLKCLKYEIQVFSVRFFIDQVGTKETIKNIKLVSLTYDF